tara:strand:- start:379 stop:558 length:180 start_codon:yes stop_codon:yes gene_type:complete
MTGYLVYSIYCYIASLISWRIEKLFRTQDDDDQKTRIFFILKHGFRISGTVLLLAHLLS